MLHVLRGAFGDCIFRIRARLTTERVSLERQTHQPLDLYALHLLPLLPFYLNYVCLAYS